MVRALMCLVWSLELVKGPREKKKERTILYFISRAVGHSIKHCLLFEVEHNVLLILKYHVVTYSVLPFAMPIGQAANKRKRGYEKGRGISKFTM